MVADETCHRPYISFRRRAKAESLAAAVPTGIQNESTCVVAGVTCRFAGFMIMADEYAR